MDATGRSSVLLVTLRPAQGTTYDLGQGPQIIRGAFWREGSMDREEGQKGIGQKAAGLGRSVVGADLGLRRARYGCLSVGSHEQSPCVIFAGRCGQ